MKTKLVRDIPIGVLLLVLGFWCVAIVGHLSGYPDGFPLVGIVLLSYIAGRLFIVGVDIIAGIQIADKNDKE